MASFEVSGIMCAFNGRTLIEDVYVSFPQGKMTAILGGNGSGKTTLLKTLAFEKPPMSGKVVIDGKVIGSRNSDELAKKIAYFPQTRHAPNMTVEEMVSLARYPYRNVKEKNQSEENAIVKAALWDFGILHLSERNVKSLSGGEKQRAYLAMALAQGTEILLLDEPTTSLDAKAEFEIMEKLQELSYQGKTIVATLHNIPLALRYADFFAIINGKSIVTYNNPDDVLHSGIIQTTFGITVFRNTRGYYSVEHT